MKIVFFGSGRFAVEILKAIHRDGHEISLVVTQPDRKRGRHLHLAPTPVKEYAFLNNLNIFQPENIKNPESIEILKQQEADIFLVVSYGKILSKEVISRARKLCINIHASLLPEYRGAAPIHWVLISGEKRTGVTFIRMNEHMDRGDIIFQKAIRIEANDNALTLEDKLSALSSGYINTILKNAANNKLRFKKQDEKRATYAPLLKKHDGLIHWDTSAQEIYNRFRGCFGWPGSYTYFRDKILKILDLSVGSRNFKSRPGEIINTSDSALEVATPKGTILLKEVLPESHKKMSAKSFLAGHKVKTGDVLGT